MTPYAQPPAADGTSDNTAYPDGEGTSEDADPPPPYESLEALEAVEAPSELAAMALEELSKPDTDTTSSGETSTDLGQHEPFRAYNWETTPCGPEFGTLAMWITHDHHRSEPGPPWFASVSLACKDVARLMRGGFFWSSHNIVPEEGYMTDQLEPDRPALGLNV